jgi:hypothetical protein
VGWGGARVLKLLPWIGCTWPRGPALVTLHLLVVLHFAHVVRNE